MKKTKKPIKQTPPASLSLEAYQQLKSGLKRQLSSSPALYQFGKGCFVLGLPLLAVNTAQAQCQTFSITNVAVPDDGGTGNGVDVDVDGDGDNDFRFFEGNNGNFKVRALGTMQIVRTDGPYTTFSAFNFGNGATVPNGLPAANLAYMDYNGGGQWAVDSGGPAATGFMGIKKGADYGFLEVTIQRVGSSYTISIPDGGAPQAMAGSAMAGDCNSLLPVELSSFVTRVDENDVTLNWQTVSESGNAGFQVQRSENGQDFANVYWMDGKGTSSDVNNYEWIDKGLKSGKTYYYRLKQVDFDGQTDMSAVVSATIKSSTSTVGEFFPNPSNTGQVAIDISSVTAKEWSANLYDAKGAILRQQSYQLEEGSNVVTMNTAALPVGIYFVKFENGDERLYKTLVID